MRILVILIAAIVGSTGCVTAERHAADVQSQNSRNLTVGTVQKEIKIGMSGADVLQVLGSPNIVSTDAQRREVWVYDKVATDRVQSSSSGWVFLIFGGGQSQASASSTSQRTLTIIIKFDDQSLVRDFAYHTSSF